MSPHLSRTANKTFLSATCQGCDFSQFTPASDTLAARHLNGQSWVQLSLFFPLQYGSCQDVGPTIKLER